MARANLLVDAELRALFLGAASKKLRWIKAELDDVNICASASGPLTADAAADLDAMKSAAMEGTSPCFVLFCQDAALESGGWVLLAYVPDKCKVRARMLYASGQDDVKNALGHSNFRGSVHVTDASELTLESINGVVKRDHTNQPLTEAELLAKEEVAQMASPSEARANAMGMVPFAFDDALDAKLRAFMSESCDLVEAEVVGDANVGLGSSTSGPTLSAATICQNEPRFYLVRQKASTSNVYFIFSCPQGIKIRTRMLYSTCKATLTHHLSELGVEITKVFEIGEPKDIDDMLKMYDTPDVEAGKMKQQNFSKPARPGRGKARVMKNT